MKFSEFGYNFLGPMLSEYFYRVLDARGCEQEFFCLAREGYVLQKIFNALKNEKLIDKGIKSQYLLVSRAILFRISIGDADSWSYSLAPKFEGTFEELLNFRYLIGPNDIETIIEKNDRKLKVILPNDSSLVTELLQKYRVKLELVVANAKETYQRYLASLGFYDSDNPLVLDIGYSGTIQKLLCKLTEKDIEGAYFIASDPGVHTIGNANAKMRGVFREGLSIGDGSIMLDRSLFIESLMTSPSGQLVDVDTSPVSGKIRFYYGAFAGAQKHISILEEIMTGATQAVLHNFRHSIRFTVDEIEMLYKPYVTKARVIPQSVKQLFEIDDAISGNGNISSTQLFQL